MTTCVSRLGYVGIEMSDLQAWRELAIDVLGLGDGGEIQDGGCFLRMDEKHHRLALHPGSRDDLAYLGWEVDEEATLDSLAERLRARGHDVAWGGPSEAKQRRVARLFRVTDPSDIVNEVYFGLEASEPFTPRRDIAGFVTGDLGVGHVVLCVADEGASQRFYRDDLGLRTSDYIAVDFGSDVGVREVAFLHAGPRHHALAIVPFAAPKRMHHLMVQVAEVDDVGTTYDLCQDRGVPIAMSLGRHTNDGMTSFYVRSPSGFQVEYGYGGVEIDDSTWEVTRYDAPSIWGHRPTP